MNYLYPYISSNVFSLCDIEILIAFPSLSNSIKPRWHLNTQYILRHEKHTYKYQSIFCRSSAKNMHYNKI